MLTASSLNIRPDAPIREQQPLELQILKPIWEQARERFKQASKIGTGSWFFTKLSSPASISLTGLTINHCSCGI